jgi:hypothetical protein
MRGCKTALAVGGKLYYMPNVENMPLQLQLKREHFT